MSCCTANPSVMLRPATPGAFTRVVWGRLPLRARAATVDAHGMAKDSNHSRRWAWIASTTG